jgi:hypothetical protein
MGFSHATWLHTVLIQTADFQMPITLSKIKYGTRFIIYFEALEQTLRLRLVSGPVDKKFFYQSDCLSRTVSRKLGDLHDLVPVSVSSDYNPYQYTRIVANVRPSHPG